MTWRVKMWMRDSWGATDHTGGVSRFGNCGITQYYYALIGTFWVTIVVGANKQNPARYRSVAVLFEQIYFITRHLSLY